MLAVVLLAQIVQISAPWPGASPADVEAELVRPLEAAVAPLPGVTGVDAVAAEGHGHLWVRGGEPRALRTALMGVVLPPGAAPPLLRRRSTAPVRWVAGPENSGESVRSALSRQPGVQIVAACVPREALRVQLDPARLTALALSVEKVIATLRGAVADLPRADVEALGELSLTAQVRLRDVATLRLDRAEDDCRCQADGRPAPCFAVRGPARPPEGARWVEAGGHQVELRGAVSEAPPGDGLRIARRDRARWWIEGRAPVALRVVPGLEVRDLGAASTRVWVAGDDEAARQIAVEAILTAARAWKGATGAWPAAASPKSEVAVKIEPAATKLGVTPTQLAVQVRAATAGVPLGAVGGMRVSLHVGEGDDIDALARLSIRTATGQTVPLSAVAEIRHTLAPTERWRRDGRPTTRLLIGGLGLKAVAARLVDVPLPKGVTVQVETPPPVPAWLGD